MQVCLHVTFRSVLWCPTQSKHHGWGDDAIYSHSIRQTLGLIVNVNLKKQLNRGKIVCLLPFTTCHQCGILMQNSTFLLILLLHILLVSHRECCKKVTHGTKSMNGNVCMCYRFRLSKQALTFIERIFSDSAHMVLFCLGNVSPARA